MAVLNSKQYRVIPTRNTFAESAPVRLVFLQIVCQILLLVPSLGPSRAIIRTLCFSVSLVFLFAIVNKNFQHPARKWIYGIWIILAIEIFHPSTNSWISGFASIAFSMAIYGPLIWAPACGTSRNQFRKLLLFFWLFHLLSCAFAVLQMYFPGQFQPPVSAFIQSRMEGGYRLDIILANGESVFRPMGLTDLPGGAAMSGFYCVLLGQAFFLNDRAYFLKLVGAASCFVGIFCILLSHIRSVFVLTLICSIAITLFSLFRGGILRFATAGLLGLVVFVGGFSWAVSVGGEGVEARFSTLVEDDVGDVYQKNRGKFFDYTFDVLLPENPLGAGLGRWGMLSEYFGTAGKDEPIWVEIQWTAWAVDGGWPLIFVALGALFVINLTLWKLIWRIRDSRLIGWGMFLLAYGVGMFALCFNYPIFASQGGLEYFLLSGAFFGVIKRELSAENETAIATANAHS